MKHTGREWKKQMEVRDVDMRKAGVERQGARRELQAARSGVRDTETNA